jgi:hypothetical protein
MESNGAFFAYLAAGERHDPVRWETSGLNGSSKPHAG